MVTLSSVLQFSQRITENDTDTHALKPDARGGGGGIGQHNIQDSGPF